MKLIVMTKNVYWTNDQWTYWWHNPTNGMARWVHRRHLATPVSKCLADQIVENYRYDPDWLWEVRHVPEER